MFLDNCPSIANRIFGRLERLRSILFWQYCDKGNRTAQFCSWIYNTPDGTRLNNPRHYGTDLFDEQPTNDQRPSEASTCCAKLAMGGFSFAELGTIYEFNGTMANGRPVYSAGEFGLWFDGDASWMVGYLDNIALGDFRLGFVQSFEVDFCPASNTAWNEWWDDGWNRNLNITVQCIYSEFDPLPRSKFKTASQNACPVPFP